MSGYQGYVTDVGYTYGYYDELNPLRIKLIFANAGLVTPKNGTACELGFGQGVSTNIHAAATVTDWYGTDFNPSQVGFAQELATEAGTNVKLYEDAFLDFSKREDIPEFDYIAIHGIWSWVSDESRQVIVDFIRRKLKVGGVLYISYNTQPGWAAFAPMRDLLLEHKKVLGTAGNGVVSNLTQALSFANQLMETNPLYSQTNPSVKAKLNALNGKDSSYLVHEYFNESWLPMRFAEIANMLESAKVDYACSANFLDTVDSIHLTEEQQSFLANIPDTMFRETVRDFMVDRQFRRDYWVKGKRVLNAFEKIEQLHNQKIILVVNRDDVSLNIKGTRGACTLSEGVYAPILDALSDYEVKSLSELEQVIKVNDISFTRLIEAVMILAGMGVISATQDEDIIEKASTQTKRLNQYLISQSRYKGDIACLASPVTGGGVPVDRIQQMFLSALNQGIETPAGWTDYACELLTFQQQAISKNGKAIEAKEGMMAELLTQAKDFSEKRLPILKALQVV